MRRYKLVKKLSWAEILLALLGAMFLLAWLDSFLLQLGGK